MKANLALITACLLISACSSAPVAPTAATPTETAAPSVAQESNAKQETATPPVVVSTNELAAQLQEMQKRSVYFDFDSFVVKGEFHALVQQQAEFMKAHNDITVILQGNADERGSPEYNLALGSKRADTVRKSLVILGVPADQIRTVSFGEEKPRLSCHEEKCWGENRRVDFAVKMGN